MFEILLVSNVQMIFAIFLRLWSSREVGWGAEIVPEEFFFYIFWLFMISFPLIWKFHLLKIFTLRPRFGKDSFASPKECGRFFARINFREWNKKTFASFGKKSFFSLNYWNRDKTVILWNTEQSHFTQFNHYFLCLFFQMSLLHGGRWDQRIREVFVFSTRSKFVSANSAVVYHF